MTMSRPRRLWHSSTASRSVEPTAGLSRNRQILWLTAEGLSIAGDHVFYLALGWIAVSRYGPSGLGWILAAGALPRGILMLIGGAFADRVGPLRLTILSDISRAATLATLCALIWANGPSFPLLIVLAVIFGLADAIYYPASGSLPSLFVPSDQVVRIQNVRNLLNRLALVTGAPLGGVLVAWAGPTLPFLLDAATFLLCAIALLACRSHALRVAPSVDKHVESRGSGVLADLRSGLSYVRRRPALVMPLVAAGLFEFATGGVINVGLPSIASARTWGSSGLGMLEAGLGAGACTVALTLSLVPGLAEPKRIYIAAGVTIASALLTLAGATGLALAIAATAVLGCGAGAIAGAVLPQLQNNTPASHIGRVMSMFYFLTAGLAPISLAAMAALIDTTTIVTGLTAAAVTAACAAATGYLGTRAANPTTDAVPEGATAVQPAHEQRLGQRHT
ncbi:MFS transporter [Streptomyces thermodiastaticus]